MQKTIVLLGFVQALFGMFLFWSKYPRHLSFSLLAIWLGVIAFFQGAQLLPFQVVDYFKPGVFPIMFLFGPLLYLYVRSLTIEQFQLMPKHLLHLIPMLLVGIHRSFTQPVSVSTFENVAQSSTFFYNRIYYILLLFSLFVYWLWAVKLIFNHRRNIPYFFSNYNRRNTLSWLIVVVVLFLLLFSTDALAAWLLRLSGKEPASNYYLSTNLTLFTFIVVFFGLNQNVLFRFKDPDEDDKYKHSALQQDKLESINQKIVDYLQNQKTYLNPDFNFQMMAEDLNLSRQVLSQVINTGQKKNFSQLINEYRVEHVKQMLVDTAYAHLSLLGVAYECGFNSKTSFNRIFKEHTGQTPTAFKKAIQQK
jgi:AraC-like DNA-binding protein